MQVKWRTTPRRQEAQPPTKLHQKTQHMTKESPCNS